MGERLGGHQNHVVFDAVGFTQIDAQIMIDKLDAGKRVPARHPGKVGGAMGEQGFAIAHQEIEYPVRGHTGRQFRQRFGNLFPRGAGGGTKAATQLLQ